MAGKTRHPEGSAASGRARMKDNEVLLAQVQSEGEMEVASTSWAATEVLPPEAVPIPDAESLGQHLLVAFRRDQLHVLHNPPVMKRKIRRPAAPFLMRSSGRDQESVL
eukprot:GAFH01004773.1.p3 GENE.GAFH01004773.1~~GAFH01004773.1.p3  ORF type:complete len:108 (-),score=0.14 GAFH01004773.1:240-563(-)